MREDDYICLVSYDAAYPAGFEELGRRQPDTSRLRDLTDWRLMRSLDDAIDDVIRYECADGLLAAAAHSSAIVDAA